METAHDVLENWAVYDDGRAYQIMVNRNSDIWVFQDESGFTIWRGWWDEGQSKPFKERVIGECLSWERAVVRVKAYLEMVENARQEWREQHGA